MVSCTHRNQSEFGYRMTRQMNTADFDGACSDFDSTRKATTQPESSAAFTPISSSTAVEKRIVGVWQCNRQSGWELLQTRCSTEFRRPSCEWLAEIHRLHFDSVFAKREISTSRDTNRDCCQSCSHWRTTMCQRRLKHFSPFPFLTRSSQFLHFNIYPTEDEHKREYARNAYNLLNLRPCLASVSRKRRASSPPMNGRETPFCMEKPGFEMRCLWILSGKIRSGTKSRIIQHR